MHKTIKPEFDGLKFSKKLKQKRIIDEDIDMRTLAKKLKISISTLSRCENGRPPDFVSGAILCKWLDVLPHEFLKSK